VFGGRRRFLGSALRRVRTCAERTPWLRRNPRFDSPPASDTRRRHILDLRLSAQVVRRTVFVSVLVASTSGVAIDAASAGTAVFSGACTLTVDAVFSGAVTSSTGPRSVSIGGSGTCIVNGAAAALTLYGSLATTSSTGGYSCTGGVATGTGVVDITAPGFPSPSVQLVVVQTGGAVVLVAVALLLRFEGVAELVQDPTDVAACPAGGYTATTWSGGLAFQDPYPSPV
jgi:hypothetical protein